MSWTNASAAPPRRPVDSRTPGRGAPRPVGIVLDPFLEFVIVILTVRPNHFQSREPRRVELSSTAGAAAASSTAALVTTTASSKPSVSTAK